MRIAIAFAAACLVLAGCSQQAAESPTQETPRGTNAPSASESAAAPSEEPTEEPSDDGVAQFGETYTWEDGIAVTISKPKPFKPSESAAGGENGEALKFTVRIVNGTDAKYDPSLFSATVQSGNKEAEQVFDSAKEINGAPSTSVLKGREVEFPIVFAVSDPKDIVMDVAPDYEHETVTFTS